MKQDPKLHQELTAHVTQDWSDSETAREFGTRDLTFARQTQWDDDLDANVDTQYRGQFDIVRPERRRIQSDLMANEFSNKFRGTSDEQEVLAEYLQGHYRAFSRTNSAKMAVEIAVSEAIDCGVGAWRIEVVDEDESDQLNTNKKMIRTPIHEANNKVVWDSNSKLIDKSDARRCAVVTSYTHNAWKELMSDYGLSEAEAEFPLPEYLYNTSICWVDAQTYTLAEYYEIKERKQKVTLLSDGVDTVALTTGEMRTKGDYYKSMDYEKVNTKTVIKKEVWKTILTGSHILERKKIAGKYIPVLSLYGEWSFVNSTEVYEGVVRPLRDPQQMKNMAMSYTFDMLAKGAIEKDIYAQEQIDGYEAMYEEQNRFKAPYYLQNLLDEQGNQLPLGPLGKRGGPNVPQAAAYLIDKADLAVQQATGGGITPEQMINPQVTEDQLMFIKARLDQQGHLYQEHIEYTYRREGEVFKSILAEITDTERELAIISADGTDSTVTVNKVDYDPATLDLVVKNDMALADSMEVFTDVGLSFATQKEKVRSEMTTLLQNPNLSPEERQIAQWTYAMNLEGSEFKPMRDNARKNMVLAGYIDETDLTEKEQVMLQQAQQAQSQQQPDAMMIAAQAEQTKADAQMMGEQTDAKKAEIDMYNAQTSRMELQLKAQEMGINLNIKQAETQANVENKNADTAKKYSEIQNSRVDTQLKVKDSFNPIGA